MRVLHTSDWHVGRFLHRMSRLSETEDALKEIASIAERESVDVIVVTGDIFEHQSPTAEAEEVVYAALERFHETGATTVLLAGNHDHPLRWHALSPLLKRINVLVVDDLLRPEDGGIVEVQSRDGKEMLQIACVPWVSERRSYGAADLMGLSEQSYVSYADKMHGAIHSLCEGFEAGKCHMLAAHIFVTGSAVSTSERPLTIGEIYAVAPNAIPPAVQYAGLGHVHRPQKAPNVSIPANYCGSLLQIDFGEVGQDKEVVIVDLQPEKPAKVREVLLTSGRRLRDVRGTLTSLRDIESDPEREWLRVTLICDGPQIGLSDQVREILPNTLSVVLEQPEARAPTPVDIKSKSPRLLFSEYLSSRYQNEPAPALLDLFDELYAEVSGETHFVAPLEPVETTEAVA